MWTPASTLPATAHLKAMDSAVRLRPNRIIARGTNTAAKMANTGEVTVASVAAAAAGVTWTPSNQAQPSHHSRTTTLAYTMLVPWKHISAP